MDELKSFHRQRIKVLLHKLNATSNNKALDTRTVMSSTAHKVFLIPELLLLIMEFVAPRSWPTLRLVSKSFAEILQALIWRKLSCTTGTTAELLLPYIRNYAHLIQILDFSGLPQSSMSDLLQELSQAKYLRLSTLILQGTELTFEQLVYILKLSPQLHSVDITGCQFHLHPLDILSQCSHLESIAFDQGDSTISGILQSNLFSPWPKIKSLCIVQRAQDPFSRPVLLLQESIQNSSQNLQSLELNKIHGWMDSTLQSILAASHSLSRLCLVDCDFFGNTLQNVGSSTLPLSSLQIHNCGGILAQDCLYIVQACPRIRDLDLAGFTISADIFEQIAKAATHLASFSIENCEFPIEGLANIPIHCRGLLRLRVSALLGREALDVLFGGQLWSCRDLEELDLGDIQWPSAKPTHEQQGKKAVEAMWVVLASLKKLRILALRGLGSKDVTHRGSKLRRIDALSKLERLHLTGLGQWDYNDMMLLAEIFPWLEEFEYSDKELSTPLWAWLKRNKPGLRLVSTS